MTNPVGVDIHEPLSDFGCGRPILETFVRHECQIQLLDAPHKIVLIQQVLGQETMQIGVLGIIENLVLELHQVQRRIGLDQGQPFSSRRCLGIDLGQ